MATPGGSQARGAPEAEHLQPSSSTSSSSTTTTGPTSLTIRVLEESTDNFSKHRVVGQGGYGTVYKGILENGEEIALKVLHNNAPGINDEQFKYEFGNLMKLKHKNIIRLVAYCYETRYQHMELQGKHIFSETTCRVLCFEYMPMGSLKKHLYDETQGLDWRTRYKIINGICEGLKYLHEGIKEPIYHLDLKPDNILLDKNMVPKIADFGLSKLFGKEQTRATQIVAGTFGYMPPEYLFGNIVSKKFDVYSLGVVITQIIAGPEGHTRSVDMGHQKFLDQVHANWRKRLEETCTSVTLEANCRQVSVCTDIGLRCMEFDRHKRPSILEIIHKLDGTEPVIEEAAQLLVMLRAQGIGGNLAWDQVQGKLVQIATYVANPREAGAHRHLSRHKYVLLGLLEETRNLRLDHPEADALLGRIMAYLEEETVRALDAGMAIARLRELLLVVADQLDMLPLCVSDPVLMVDEDSNFCEESVKCSAPNDPYAVVSILGPRYSGKSYLLNRLFGTKFPLMKLTRGLVPNQSRVVESTRGIMMSRCIGPSLFVLDFEGFTGTEKEQDTLFKRQALIFALTISDVMLVNTNIHDIGREQGGGIQLCRPIFKERVKLEAGLTKILVVIRMYDGETPLETLRDDVREVLEKIWRSVNAKSLRFEDYIEVNVVGLPDKKSESFEKERDDRLLRVKTITGVEQELVVCILIVATLRRLISKVNTDRSSKVPAPSFFDRSKMFWDTIGKE